MTVFIFDAGHDKAFCASMSYAYLLMFHSSSKPKMLVKVKNKLMNELHFKRQLLYKPTKMCTFMSADRKPFTSQPNHHSNEH